MESSESIENIMAAIQNVQQNAGTISKGSQGQVGSRTYKYAGLVETWEVVKPLMKANDLVAIQSPTVGSSGMGHLFGTTIYHIKSKEWIRETMPMILQKEDPQGIGSAITYYRRYMLTSMLGLIPDDDNDARDHRLATAEQKQKIVGAVKELSPEVGTPAQIIETITNIVGKHPSQIREDEAGKVVDLIKAFKD